MKRFELEQIDSRSTSALEIHALDGGLYSAMAVIDGERRALYHLGERLHSRHLPALRQALSLSHCPQFLVQHSAYDEMVGQPGSAMGNTLRIPLARLIPERAAD